MEPAMVMAVVVILISAGASFFFALAEAALLSLNKWQARQLAERHPRAGARVARLLEQPQDLLATMAFGNTFANAAMLAVALQMVFDDRWPFLWTMALLLALILIGCEVLPKTLAVRQPERWAQRVGGPLLLFQRFTTPLRYVAQKMNEAILKLAAPQFIRPAAVLTDGEYHELLEMAYQQGTLAGSEKEIILQIVSLDQRMVRDVMRPRTGMACLSDDATVTEMMAAAKRFRHRRVPIYDETPDTIVGILNTRALLLDPGIDLADAIEFPSFVPETMNLLQLFQSLQKQQRGLAVVLDEFGSTAGIVTMEDILGQIVGKIRGEARQPEGFVLEKLTPGRWRVNGTLRLDDFRREFPALKEVAEVETMGGLLVHLLGVVPKAGESTTFNGLKLTAQAADERRVRELLVETVK
jgi:CBS domain containing-hemolysin-like protein